MGYKIIADIYNRSNITDIHSSCVHYNVQTVCVFSVFPLMLSSYALLMYSKHILLVTHKSFLFLKQVSFCILYIYFKRQNKTKGTVLMLQSDFF